MIDVRNIHFNYPGQKNLVFKSFNLRLEQNRIYPSPVGGRGIFSASISEPAVMYSNSAMCFTISRVFGVWFLDD